MLEQTIKTSGNNGTTKQVSQTYEERALAWIKELKPDEYVKHLFTHDSEDIEKMVVRDDIKEAVIRFSHFLDSFNGISKDMEILALYKAREIDREFMLALIEEVGPEKGKEIAQKVTMAHAHTTPEQMRSPEEIDAAIAEGIQAAAKEEGEEPLKTTLA